MPTKGQQIKKMNSKMLPTRVTVTKLLTSLTLTGLLRRQWKQGLQASQAQATQKKKIVEVTMT